MQNDSDEIYDYRYKVLILGDTKVGKSTLLDNLTIGNGKILKNQNSDEISERVILYTANDLDNKNNFTYRISFFEISSKERHIEYLKNYCLGGTIAIIMTDCTKYSTLERAEAILKGIESCDVPLKFIVNNKVDLLKTKKDIKNPCTEEDLKTLAKNYMCNLYNSSSIDNEYVRILFNKIVDNIRKLIGDNLELKNLIGKNVNVGKKLFDHPLFLESLKDAQYFKD